MCTWSTFTRRSNKKRELLRLCNFQSFMRIFFLDKYKKAYIVQRMKEIRIQECVQRVEAQVFLEPKHYALYIPWRYVQATANVSEATQRLQPNSVMFLSIYFNSTFRLPVALPVSCSLRKSITCIESLYKTIRPRSHAVSNVHRSTFRERSFTNALCPAFLNMRVVTDLCS